MPGRSDKPRAAWDDQFRSPTVDDLLSPFRNQEASCVVGVRDALLGLGGLAERAEWLGIPWRWSLVYESEPASDRGWAFLVPDPSKPRLAIPLLTEEIARLPARKLSRPVRDGITNATEIAGVHWACWDLLNPVQAEELLLIAQTKHQIKHLIKHQALAGANTA